MVKGKVRITLPAKSFNSKNKLDMVRKLDIMGVFVHLNRHKNAQERRDTMINSCLCYLLTMKREPSDKSALLFKKYTLWFFKNLVSFNKLDKKYTPLFSLYIEKLDDIKDKYDNDLRYECYFYDTVDDIFAAIKDIGFIKNVFKRMIMKQNKKK